MDTITDSYAVSMSPFSSGPNYKPERLLYDHNAPGLRQLQNSLVQPFQRLLGDPINIAESRKPPTQSQNWFAESVPTVSSARNESTTAGSSYANLAPGYQPTAMPVDEVFASEIAAQRKTVADSRKIAEAAKWKRLREQRVARNEALAVQKAERAKWIAEEEASRKRHIAEPEAQRLKKTAEQEAQRMKQTSEREVEMENQRLAEEKAKSESQVLVEQGPDIGEQNHEKRRIPRQQRVKTNLQHEADRHHNMRAQEKLLEQVYKEHNIDVVKVETRSGGAMYAPWDSNVGDILDQQKQEELDRKGLYFWLEAGTAVSVSQNNDSLETTEDVTMSG
ncbi:hypothetical protein MMC26_000921 [Xylographa opegraphella]|nr:hypothetical protein [Xylographa opegraphella]